MTGGKNRPVKKFKSGRKYDCDSTTFVNVIIPGNSFGKKKGSHFLGLLCWTVECMISEDPRLLVLPYSNQPNSYKAQLVEKNAVAISNIQRARPITDNLWIREVISIKVNLCIAHNCVAVTFVSIEFRQVLEEKDVEIDINPIQSPNTVFAGYLLGLIPTMVDKIGVIY